MYVKDSIIQARIEKDLKKEQLKGRIEEIECRLNGECDSGLRGRLKKLKEELELLQD